MPIKSSREERLQKIIARAGLASRRAAELMIAEGRVQVDGRVVKELGTKADPNQSDIRVDGTRIHIESRRRYIVLNKPRGYVTTRSDPGGRPTVMELLPHSLRSLYPVGRLDMSSTGLLLLTDDGDFAQRVGHPRFGIEKTYVVTVRGTPSDRALERARNGIQVEGERLKVKWAHALGPRRASPRKKDLLHTSGNYGRTAPKREQEKVETTKLNVVLVEGKNREVRRLFKALGHPVLDLHRSRVGVLSDRGLPTGTFRPLSALEIRQIKSPPSSRTPRDRRNASYRGDSPRTPRDHRNASSRGDPSSKTRSDRRNVSYGGDSPNRGVTEARARARRPPAFAKVSARPRHSSKSGGGSAFIKAPATADKPARPRRPSSNKQRRVSPKPSVKSENQSKGGARRKGKGRPAFAKASTRARHSMKGVGGKGEGRAFSEISKKPGRRTKKGT